MQRGSTKGFAWQCGSFGVAAACFHETILDMFWHRQGANNLIEKPPKYRDPQKLTRKDKIENMSAFLGYIGYMGIQWDLDGDEIIMAADSYWEAHHTD